MRFIGMDVHRDFCEVAIWEQGEVRSAGRVLTNDEDLALFAGSLGSDDEVAMEMSGNAAAIARIIEPHVARSVLAVPKKVRERIGNGPKTDRLDARVLARLGAGGFLATVWTPDEATRVRRRLISRRAQLVRQRTREKNQVHAVMVRNLRGKAPMSDLFGVNGRAWLAAQDVPPDEGDTVAGCLRQVDFLESEIELIDRRIAGQLVGSAEIRRLLTLPGFGPVAATALMAAIGDVSRFPSPRHPVGYLGLDPKVVQSGSKAARHGRISKRGPGYARHVLVEAALHARRSTGPMKAFGERVAARRGQNVATVTVARKLVVIAWNMLTRGEDYAFARPTLVAQKVRSAELAAGAPPRCGGRGTRPTVSATERKKLEKELAAQAEVAYRRLVADWRPAGRRD
ncbi:MAG TPA: IS110 family transposase [Solirubrobacterales bacterium]|jgi:transposase|nr:IS110 family transposase [Solirubrobacterales bacterium]